MKWTLTSLCFLLYICTSWGQHTVGLFLNGASSYPGYTLFSTSSQDVYLIDNCGYKIHSWQVNSLGFGPSYLLENGQLLEHSRVNGSSFNGGGAAGRLEQYSWDGELIWTTDYASEQFLSHHDIFPMENGNILLIAWELKADNEIEAKGRTVIPNAGFWSETVVEIKPVGSNDYEIIWKWDVIDHLVQDQDSALDNYGVIAENPQLLDVNMGFLNSSDWLHFNAIDYNPELDQILVSSRAMNEIYIIDHSTTTQEAAGHTGGLSGKGGDILFRWGNPDNYDKGTPVDQKLFGQHNARWINDNINSDGNITVFNNGAGYVDGINYSTIVEIEAPQEGYNYILDDGVYLPNDVSWEYKADPPETFYSARISSAQRLPNDNTIINQGMGGRLFEINIDGDIVWEYVNPVTSNGPVIQGSTNINTDLFKIMKYGLQDPKLAGKDLTPKGPIELEPLNYDCSISSSGIIQSPKISFNNPVSDILYIWSEKVNLEELEIFNMSGHKIVDLYISGTTSLDVSNIKPGLYFVRTKNTNFKFIKL